MRCTCLTLVALAACRDQPPAPPPWQPPHDGVALVLPGAPPLQPLRYHLTKGSKIASELVYDVDIRSSELGGPMPTQVVELETAVDDVLGDGSARLRITVVDASLRDRAGSQQSSDAAQAQIAALRGVVITETLAPDGGVSDARVAAGAASDKLRGELDGVLHGLERVATRLPAEPVGVGAMWRERRTLPEGGVRAVSEMTYTLTSFTGSTIGFASTGQSAGGPQTIEQGGTTLEVTDTHGTSSATGSVDLARYALDVVAASSFATTMKEVGPGAGPPAAGPSAAGPSAAGSSAAPDTARSTIEIAMTIRMTSSAAPATASTAAATTAGAPTPAAAPDPAAGATQGSGSAAAAPTGGAERAGAAASPPATAAAHGAHSAP